LKFKKYKSELQKRDIFTTIGASNHTELERPENDFYATSPQAIHRLVDVGKLPFHKKIWECSAGRGHLSETLKVYGYKVISTDLIDRGYGVSDFDFLQAKKLLAPCILTNPPYKYAQEFIEHAVRDLEAEEVYMFLKLTFLEGQKRRAFFEKYPPVEIIVASKRLLVARNGDEKLFDDTKSGSGSAVCYAWFVWNKGNKDAPIISWF
jgi:hypothetical protein